MPYLTELAIPGGTGGDAWRGRVTRAVGFRPLRLLRLEQAGGMAMTMTSGLARSGR